MKSEQVVEQEIDVDEYDDFQYELTSDLAHQFVDETIMPMLQEFDYNNPLEDYIPGVASFGLYIKLVKNLLGEGFTQEQLKEIVDESIVNDGSETVH